MKYFADSIQIKTFFLLRCIIVVLLGFYCSNSLDAGQRRHVRHRPIKADVTTKKISRNAVPSSVLQSFQKEYPGAKITGQLKETREGIVYYEIESIDSTIKRNILFQEDGTIVEIQEPIAEADLPKIVHDGVTEKYPNAVIQSADIVKRDHHVEYEMTLRIGKQKNEVVVNSAGKIFKIR